MMANPRRILYINGPSSDNPFQIRPSYLAFILHFFQKVSLTLSLSFSAFFSSSLLVGFSSGIPSQIAKDKRGWLLDPVSLFPSSGISGGAVTCASIHVGEIRPGRLRGNHRHNTCNETFVIWGATTKFRLENRKVAANGYAEVIVCAEEAAVAGSPSGSAHALVNIDPVGSTFFLGCQDRIINYSGSNNDYNVWKDV